MIAWLQKSYKNVYQTNDFKLRILGKKKVSEKTQIGWRRCWWPVTRLEFGWIFYLVPNILSRIEDAYYSWEYIVNMSASIKTGIVSVASKKGDYI